MPTDDETRNIHVRVHNKLQIASKQIIQIIPTEIL